MRRAPAITLPEGRLRTVISTDAAAEVDDQHAIVYALLLQRGFRSKVSSEATSASEVG